MRRIDPIALLRKCDWFLLVACISLCFSNYVEIESAGEISFGGVFHLPFRVVSSYMTFQRIAWVATFLLLVVSLLNTKKSTEKRCLVLVVWVLSAIALIMKYDEFVRKTVMESADILPLMVLFAIGCMQGFLFSLLIDFLRCIRPKNYALERGLPRVPDQVGRGIKGVVIFILIMIIPSVLVIVFWSGFSVGVDLSILMGSIVLSLLVFFMYDISGNDLSKDDKIRIFFDMIDRRLQMKEQICERSDLMLSKNDLENSSELQAFRTNEYRMLSDLKLELNFLGEVKHGAEVFLRFSYQEEYCFQESRIPKKMVMPYIVAFAEKFHIKVKDIPKDVMGKAAMYAMLDVGFKYRGYSLLWIFIKEARREDLDVIIRAETDINRVYGNTGGWTVLMFAVAEGFTYGVKLLLKAAADPNVRNANGVTPFLFAVCYDYLESVQLLYNAGANIKETDAEGANALVVAARFRAKKVVPFLLAHGIDPSQKDCHGRTALEYAQREKCGEIAILLRKALSSGCEKRKKRRR